MIWAAGAVAILVISSGLFIFQSGGDTTQQASAATPVARANPASTASVRAASAAKKIGAQAGAEAPVEDFAARIQGLKDAGNWNVLVLYAVEWTRKQPANPEAWRALSHGYLKLRQLGEALDTATQAVELASGDFLSWQNLGQVNLALQRPAEARAAFEQAAALNDRDVVSLVQGGMLNAQLGRIPEARSAFDKALLVDPNDVDALCGATSIAQKEGRLRDAEALTAQVKSADGRCRDANSGESVRVVISATPKSRAVLSPGR